MYTKYYCLLRNILWLLTGKYYLVDSGYPNRTGYLAPFKEQRYHVPDFQGHLHKTCKRSSTIVIHPYEMLLKEHLAFSR
jgi:hypothetical protein